MTKNEIVLKSLIDKDIPSEENIISIKALLSNGFKKKSDGDYRKRITQIDALSTQ